MTEPTFKTTARNATLEDMVALLRDHHARRVDIVAPASLIGMHDDGSMLVMGADPVIDETGVTEADGRYRPTATFDEGLSQKLGIPGGYLRRMRETNVDLLAENVNGWLRHPSHADKRYLVRALRGDDGELGIARAFLSDSYRPMDNLDVLMAALDGVRLAGVPVDIRGCDLTDNNMYVRLYSPEVAALAPGLLDGYRSPWGGHEARVASNHNWTVAQARAAALAEGEGYEPGTEPVLFAGFRISNSEVGKGAFQIMPELLVQICKNGLPIKADAIRAQHLGAKLDEGLVKWSSDTMEKNLQLVTAQARDAVVAFLNPEYLGRKIAAMEQVASTPVDDPAETVALIGKELKYDQARQDDILRHFIRGGQLTAGGVMQAVSSAAQLNHDADIAAQMEVDALEALFLVAAAAGA